MPLRFLLDEHLRGPLWRAIERHNVLQGLSIDAVCIGQPADLPLGSTDPEILVWAEREERILLTLDKRTMIGHLIQHLESGRHSPGIFLLRRGHSVAQIVSYLELVALAGEAVDYRDRFFFVP